MSIDVLTFDVMYFLVIHRDVCSRLRHEVLDTFGPTGMPTYADLKQMEYCAFCRSALRYHTPLLFNSRYTIVHAVLKETLRIFHFAPLVGRTSCDDSLIIPSTSNLYLPFRTQIMMTFLLTHNRTDLWGSDVKNLRPEWWSEPALLYKVAKTPFMYVPFYGGPRTVSTPSSLSPYSRSQTNQKK